MKRVILAAAAILAAGAWASAGDAAEKAAPVSSVKAQAKACKAVEARECREPGDAFAAADGAVFIWSRIENQTGGTVHHVWYKGAYKVDDVELKVAGSPWRVWSRKTLSADSKGDWRVEVRDGAGGLVETVKLTVR